jgi:hypothetical protein
MSIVNSTSAAAIAAETLPTPLGDYFDSAAGCGGELS